MANFLSVFIVILIVMTSHAVSGDIYGDTVPDIDLDEWWGPKETRNQTDTSIRPFKINFNKAMINDLRYRLRNHRVSTSPLEDSAFTYGFNLKELMYWLKYWAKEYPFQKREKYLNQFPQYKTNIQGREMHFLRIRSKNIGNKKVVPLMLLHGWPGSVREFYETIPFMIKGSEHRDFALDIIVPSLPGFGFSEGAVYKGLGVDKAAVMCRNLMNRIGYKKYVIQGGDIGAFVAIAMATYFPNEIIGYHANYFPTHTAEILLRLFLGAQNPLTVVPPQLVDRIYPLSSNALGIADEIGYLHIQATRPDTVGAGVSDSPAGLAAYIMEKFSSFSARDNKYYADGRLHDIFSKEQLIDNLMIYWTSSSIITSMRIYAETFNRRYKFGIDLNEIVSPVPTWAIQAGGELLYLPPWLIKKKFPNLLNETILPDGGHFLSLTKPEVFAQSVLNSIDGFRNWHKLRLSNSDASGL